MGAKNSLPIEAVDGFSPEEVSSFGSFDVKPTSFARSSRTIYHLPFITRWIKLFSKQINYNTNVKVARLEKRFRKLDSDGNNALRYICHICLKYICHICIRYICHICQIDIDVNTWRKTRVVDNWKLAGTHDVNT